MVDNNKSLTTNGGFLKKIVNFFKKLFSKEKTKTEYVPNIEVENISVNNDAAPKQNQTVVTEDMFDEEGMPKVEALNALVGKFVNLEYCLPNGTKVKFLDDQTTYLGNQLESEIVEGLCFGVLANMDFILVSTYEKDGKNPELILYKKR